MVKQRITDIDKYLHISISFQFTQHQALKLFELQVCCETKLNEFIEKDS